MGHMRHYTISPIAESISISKLLKARLEETGYDDDLKDLAKGMSHSHNYLCLVSTGR